MNQRALFLFIVFVILGSSMWYLFRSAPSTGPKYRDLETIIIGTNSEYQPYTFIKNDTLTGLDIDIATEVMNRLGKKFTFKDMAFDALIPEIQMGSTHMIAAGVTPTPLREKVVSFTTPHIEGQHLYIVTRNKDTNIHTIDDLQNKEVLVNEGYFADTFISQLPNIEIIRLSSPLISDGLLALKNGRGDAFIASKSSLDPAMQKQGVNTFRLIKLDETDEVVALAVSKKYPDLLERINEIIKQMKEDGTLKKLLKKWNVND